MESTEEKTTRLRGGWTPAYEVGQWVFSKVFKDRRVGVVSDIDAFGYNINWHDKQPSYEHEWELGAATTEQVRKALHKTRTTEPEGWTSSPASAGSDKRQGKTFSGACAALCSCGWSYHAGSRDEARRAARTHRADPGPGR